MFKKYIKVQLVVIFIKGGLSSKYFGRGCIFDGGMNHLQISNLFLMRMSTMEATSLKLKMNFL